MTLRDYELRDPGALVGHVLASRQPGEGDAYLAVVHDPPGAQTVLHVSAIAAAEWAALDESERSEFLRARVDKMPIDKDGWRRPKNIIVTVLARSGLAVFGAEESEWLYAWRYSNHLAPVLDAGIVLVTEHGWVDFMSQRGASAPCLAR